MVVTQETLDALENLGLNMYERKVYSALISRGVSTAGELSEMTGVPRSRSYDVLESLAEKGFAIMKPSKPMEYVAVPPGEAVENTKRRHRKELDELLGRIDRFKGSDAANELQQVYDQGVNLVDPAEMTGAIKGKYNVNKRLANMLGQAEEEIKIMTTESGLQEIKENHASLLEDAAESGADIRILAPINEKTEDAVESLDGVAEVKSVDEDAMDKAPSTRFVIVDDRSVALSLTADDIHPTQDTVFWSESKHAARDALSPVFDLVWRDAK